MAQLLDPVCGMTVSDTALRAPGYDDVAFCAPGCRTTFLNNPDAFPARLETAEATESACCGGSAKAEAPAIAEPVTADAGSACCG
jgi:YHS domain-containing protein